MSLAERTRQVLADKGRASIAEIAEALRIEEGTQAYHSIGQSLSNGIGKWSERVGRGEYVWYGSNGSRVPKPATPEELRPLIDNLNITNFEAIGLTYVARAQDGAFICTDRQGVAWRVEVTVTAKLI